MRLIIFIALFSLPFLVRAQFKKRDLGIVAQLYADKFSEYNQNYWKSYKNSSLNLQIGVQYFLSSRFSVQAALGGGFYRNTYKFYRPDTVITIDTIKSIRAGASAEMKFWQPLYKNKWFAYANAGFQYSRQWNTTYYYSHFYSLQHTMRGILPVTKDQNFLQGGLGLGVVYSVGENLSLDINYQFIQWQKFAPKQDIPREEKNWFFFPINMKVGLLRLI